MRFPTRLVSYAASFVTLLVCVMMLLMQSLSLIEQSQKRESQILYRDFISQIQAKGRTAVNIAATLANQENVKQAMSEFDRDTLESIMLSTWRLLQSEYNVKQFQFHTPNGESFKRMHAPHLFGDSLVAFRHTLVEALARETSIVGLEKGVYGVGIRGVVPIFDNNNSLIGSVELGFSFDEAFLNTFALDAKADVAVYFEDKGKYILYASTLSNDELEKNGLASQLAAPQVSWKKTVGENQYLYTSDVIKDFNGSKMGYVVFRMDRSFYHQSTVKAFVLAGSILFTGLVFLFIIYYVNRSIAKRKEIEAQQKAALEKSEEQNKNMLSYIVEKEKIASLNKVVAGLAHEINTPLGVANTANSIAVSNVSELADKYSREELTEGGLKGFLTSSGKALALVESNLLRITRLVEKFKGLTANNDSYKEKQISVRETLLNVLNSFENQVKEQKAVVNIDIDEKMVITCNYPDMINILTHAFSNMLQHGVGEAVEPQLNIAAEIRGDFLFLTMTDNGPGVSADLFPYLFEPFYTTARNKQCTGLGLSIIHNTVVYNLGGDVSIVSPVTEQGGFQLILKIPVYGKLSGEPARENTNHI
ncbi:hypothetical protein KIH87_16850 [Paraneptunicella aestuarii]|uniref:cache domain-containing protein n=1 Tax=Paraneptunicella aestuarii TaxID=2831148 RepID=UPI001E2F1ABB|nr:cache domain-containing protein [Paraneptunicella aestuarii]UAA38334.1 hypothetical protein KIH87_16850 [Paraneptunicella aestuarii]